VTSGGGILYTGITSTSGDCNGDSFLRYRKPDGQLQELTQGWWDYRFEPIPRGEFAGHILFYGPDPRQAATPDWNDACLYRFDPEAEGEERAVQIADCDIDVWRYVEEATGTERIDRCHETRVMIGGGNQPDKIFLSDSYGIDMMSEELVYGAPDGEDEPFVVSHISKKLEGEYRCSFCVEPDPMDASDGHCVDELGQPVPLYTEQDCSSPNSWRNNNDYSCYNEVAGALCTEELPSHFRRQGGSCQQPGSDWLETYSALARINDDGSTTMLSSTSEVVTNSWSLDGRLVYSAFHAERGRYEFSEVSDQGSELLLFGIEVYEVIVDPRDPSKWFLNGLRFEDNAYIMGVFDPSTGDLDVETGITGQIETLVIIPDDALGTPSDDM
jgi:hypothetical protein